jgi:DNA-binding NarL/FixJ family response regulator
MLIRRSVATQSIAQPKSSVNPSVYLFYEKTTGTAHFHVEAGPDGEFPIDHAAGLLAMHCMVRGQSPSDYLIMVPAAPENLQDLNKRAQSLLDAGHSVKASVKLTRREEEVLDGILRSLANKEIASELNLSERTVKFHVSSLLSKF